MIDGTNVIKRCLGPFVRRLEQNSTVENDSTVDKGRTFASILLLALIAHVCLTALTILAGAIIPSIVLVVAVINYSCLLFAMSRCRTDEDISLVATFGFSTLLAMLTFMGL